MWLITLTKFLLDAKDVWSLPSVANNTTESKGGRPRDLQIKCLFSQPLDGNISVKKVHYDIKNYHFVGCFVWV
jgi:hypothetical protein